MFWVVKSKGLVAGHVILLAMCLLQMIAYKCMLFKEPDPMVAIPLKGICFSKPKSKLAAIKIVFLLKCGWNPYRFVQIRLFSTFLIQTGVGITENLFASTEHSKRLSNGANMYMSLNT